MSSSFIPPHISVPCSKRTVVRLKPWTRLIYSITWYPLFEINFNATLPFMSMFPKWCLRFRFFLPKPVRNYHASKASRKWRPSHHYLVKSKNHVLRYCVFSLSFLSLSLSSASVQEYPWRQKVSFMLIQNNR